MKNLLELEFLVGFGKFCVKLKLSFSSEGHISHQKAYRRTPTVVVESFQSFDSWKGWSFHESCVGKYKNVIKCKICWLFRGLCCNFFSKLHLSPQTTLLDNEIIRCWSYSTFWSTKPLEIWQKLHKKVKNWYILKFSSFLVAKWAFLFSVELFVYALTIASLTSNLFLVERL